MFHLFGRRRVGRAEPVIIWLTSPGVRYQRVDLLLSRLPCYFRDFNLLAMGVRVVNFAFVFHRGHLLSTAGVPSYIIHKQKNEKNIQHIYTRNLGPPKAGHKNERKTLTRMNVEFLEQMEFLKAGRWECQLVFWVCFVLYIAI